jgi:hypothetical protein
VHDLESPSTDWKAFGTYISGLLWERESKCDGKGQSVPEKNALAGTSDAPTMQDQETPIGSQARCRWQYANLTLLVQDLESFEFQTLGESPKIYSGPIMQNRVPARELRPMPYAERTTVPKT